MWALIIRSLDEVPREYSLIPSINTLGRSKENNIYISDDAASRFHAEIEYDQEKNSLILRDLESTNGTYVNGKKVLYERNLGHEDQIQIGKQLITLISQDELSNSISQLSIHSMSRTLMSASIDSYAALIHDIGAQLNSLSDLDESLNKVSESILRMIGADNCQIFLADKINHLEKKNIPTSITNQIIEQRSALIIPNVQTDPSHSNNPILKQIGSLLVVPAMRDSEVIALIYATKIHPSPIPFNQRDLALLVAISHQISQSIQRKRTEEKLIHASNHDPLTNLPNRTLFFDRLGQLIARAKRRDDYLFAVLFIDLDNFKIINDSLGHIAGDKLLIEVARRLEKCMREEDTLARFGGDEFVILVDDPNELEKVITFSERILEKFTEPFSMNKKSIYITLSIGIALNIMEYDQPEDILRYADIAMYRAKSSGKASLAVYDNKMHDSLLDRLHLQTVRRNAMSNNELRLHYQPLVSLKESRVVGFEALLRWQSPEGLIFPKKFFSIPDTTGLLNKIDHWILKTACQQIVRWNKDFSFDPPLHIAVNLSAKQLKHPNLVDQVIKTLNETELEPKLLWLEIPESASLANSDATLKILDDLRKVGVILSLDDFGTGFSSFSYLHKFPINALKIDRSFVKRIGDETNGSQITKTIVTLAKALDMKSIAEGIETEEQLSFLKSIKTHYGQGFLFSKALPPEEMIDFLNLNKTSGKKRRAQKVTISLNSRPPKTHPQEKNVSLVKTTNLSRKRIPQRRHKNKRY